MSRPAAEATALGGTTEIVVKPSPEEYEAARERVVAVSRALLAGEISAIHAAPQIAQVRWELDPEQEDDDLLGFVYIDSMTDVLLVVDSIKDWHPSVREQKAREVAEAEAIYLPQALEHAAALIARFAPSA